MNYPILGVIVILLLVALGVFAMRRARGMPALDSGLSRRTRIGIAVGLTAVLGWLWIWYDLSVALLPVLLAPVWVPLAQGSEQTPSRNGLLLALIIGLGVAFLVGLGVFFLTGK